MNNNQADKSRLKEEKPTNDIPVVLHWWLLLESVSRMLMIYNVSKTDQKKDKKKKEETVN
jgi:hypothetical protein